MNKLYLGDCLHILRNELEIKADSVDLIYIDPPFNSKRNYNVFFDDKEIQRQRIAFEDTWSLQSVGDSLSELNTRHHRDLLDLLTIYQKIAPQVFPYLVMMSLRIIELHKVLKPTGSFYLHCDPTASHYLKTVCDTIFGAKNFRNEVVWQRTKSLKTSQFKNRKYGVNTDSLLFYSKTEHYFFDSEKIKIAFDEDMIEKRYSFEDSKGKYTRSPLFRSLSMGERQNLCYEYKGITSPSKAGWKISKSKLVEIDKAGDLEITKNNIPYRKFRPEHTKGFLISNLWIDIEATGGKERLGYPTQKPRELLARVIQASSNEGDLVLDAFCGCGTTIDAAESLNRQWIGIDIAPFAVSLIKRRLQHTYADNLSKFQVRGVPEDEASAIKLWAQNPFAFEDWWLTELGVFATTYGKKGADKGIDGIGEYIIPKRENPIIVAFQVKGGKTQSKDIDALMGVVALGKYDTGVLLTRHKPTAPMLKKATQAGQFEATYGYTYPKIQIMTLADFFAGKLLNLPKDNITFKSAVTVGKSGKQNKFL